MTTESTNATAATAPEPNLIEILGVVAGDGTDCFAGEADAYGALGIYGGHLIGQALAAGLATVEEPKLAQSLHGYFRFRATV